MANKLHETNLEEGGGMASSWGENHAFIQTDLSLHLNFIPRYIGTDCVTRLIESTKINRYTVMAATLNTVPSEKHLNEGH